VPFISLEMFRDIVAPRFKRIILQEGDTYSLLATISRQIIPPENLLTLFNTANTHLILAESMKN
jgi:hypothetical protein